MEQFAQLSRTAIDDLKEKLENTQET